MQTRTIVQFLITLLTASSLFAETRFGGVAGNTATADWSSGVTYAYDPSGNVTRMGSDRFAYDEVGRLVSAEVNGVIRTYSYDAFGNRKSCQSTDGTDCQYAVKTDPATNRSSLKAGSVETLQYDARGNLLNLGSHAYTYDAVNMLVRDTSGSIAREYLYTADDERLAISSGTAWTWTIRDMSGKVLREFASTNGSQPGNANFTWTRDNVFRDGVLLATRQPLGTGFSTNHYHVDHLGTPRQVTDDRDLVVGSHDYYAFGPEAPGGKEEPNRSPLRYTGHERDAWLNESLDTLDYMHARFASPVLGRFLSVDPNVTWRLAVPQLWNRYTYAANNPLKYIDPDGREITISVNRRERVTDVNIRLTVEVSRETRSRPMGSELRSNLQGAARILGGTFKTRGGNVVNVSTTIDVISTFSGGTDPSRHQLNLINGLANPLSGWYHETELGGNESTMNEDMATAKYLAHEFAHWMGLDDLPEYDPTSTADWPFMGNLMDNRDGAAITLTYEQWLEIQRMYREKELNDGVRENDQ